MVNIVAETENANSVKFELVGPVTLERVDNAISYTIVDELINWNLANDDLPVGEYELTITAYAGGERARQSK